MTDRADETISWDEVRALVAARFPHGVIDRLGPVPAAELRHLRAPLRKLRTELVRELTAGDPGRYRAAYDQLAALQFAGILSAATPTEALDWLTSRRLLDVSWPLPGGGATSPDHHVVLRALLVPHRDAAFHRELAVRLAEWLPARGDANRWLIAHGLAVWSGAEVPTTDGYVIGWLREGGLMHYHHREIGEWFADQGLREPVPHHDSLLSWLRAQPRIGEFVRRLFEVPDVGTEFADRYAAVHGPQNQWPTALTALAGEGLFDRAELIDLCLGLLLRGDRPGNLRGFLQLHTALALDAEEILARARDHVQLAVDGAPGAAKAAQTALGSVNARLPGDLLAELTAGVLARPEKALATAQLGQVEAALRRDPAAAEDLLPAAVTAFTHPAPAIQEQALRLVARYLPHVTPATAEAVRAAADGLGPALQRDARSLLALTAPSAGPSEDMPVVAAYGGPAPLPAPPADPLETAERLSAVMAARLPDLGEFETVLAALVAEHHRDEAALRDALAPLAERRDRDPNRLLGIRSIEAALGCLLDALTGRANESDRHTATLLGLPAYVRTPAVAPVLRIHEAARRITTAPVPFLLATPTAGDGTIDGAVLVERLTAYRNAGARPWPEDVAQALLRVAPHALAAVRTAAGGLGFDLPADPAPPAPQRFHVQSPFQPEPVGPHGRRPPTVPRIAPLPVDGAVVADADAPAHTDDAAVPEGVTDLLQAVPDPTEHARFVGVPSLSSAELLHLAWLAPWHPEAVAAHGLPSVAFRADPSAPRGADPLLPRFAEAPGEFGPVSHLLLAYGLTATRAESRTAALDFLLTATARGRLRPEVLGEWLAALWRLSVVKPNRILPVLADAARSGAGPAVWATLAAVITEAVDEPGRRALADVLALAAECAAAEGIRTTLPALGILAGPAAPGRVRTEAARLAKILTT
ncbi:hypothetical protein ACFVYP_33380 [Kitasatospora sp. NPDC058201]|uniref:hypothetical protein n=1 Tax=unclassified Kitasatospora TaxID=2633591 RepID=UPI00364B2CEC